MKQLFAATAILMVAVMAAEAQVASDKTEHAALPQASSPEAQCTPESTPPGDCRPKTEPPSNTAGSVSRSFLTVAAPDFDQSRTGTAGAVVDGLKPARPEGSPAAAAVPAARDKPVRPSTRFDWRAASKQSMLFLSIQHGYALTQPKTRRDLSGNFWKDYARSVRSLHGWADGGRFFTNYVAHPMQGSLLGFVQIQNDPAGSRLRFNEGRRYWRSRMKALAWSAAWSTQFEIGPVSQASIGNVGLHGKQTYVDIVMTPTAGTGLLVAEDALDRYVIERLERRSQNRYVRIFSRMALNPTRTAANLLRFKKPWHRDAGLR